MTLIDCSIGQTSIKHKERDYSGINFLLIDRKFPMMLPSVTPNILPSIDAPFVDEIQNIFHIDTHKNKIRKRDVILNDLEIYSYIMSRYEKNQISMPACDLYDYMKEKMTIKSINISSKINSLEVDCLNLYDLDIKIPCKDKSLLMKVFEEPEQFKDILINKLLSDSRENYENDFMKYREINISKDFYDLIQIEGKRQILEINEKFKEDPNEINYAPVVADNFKELKEETNLITPTQVEKIKIIKDVYLENLDASRVNNSRTKLTKVFSKNLLYKIEDELFYPQQLTDEAKDFLENILLAPKEPLLINRLKI